MDALWKTALWQQFGAAIDMLENALLACPDTHWRGRLWSNVADDAPPSEAAEFWYITYHTLFWLDLYLTGSREGFVPPAPFTLSELDPAGALPERPYTREELQTYLRYLRKKCQTTIAGLSDEMARRDVSFRWLGNRSMSFFELCLYTMRHVQEHGAQLSMFLGQSNIHADDDWVAQAKTI
ncbi:MAG TPA: DinB family protein [Ktedonobacteraceae bacterium]|nr:DinB family protein [Ktedonobacteraceae bacterium]